MFVNLIDNWLLMPIDYIKYWSTYINKGIFCDLKQASMGVVN
jgi:hypothetical protein